MIINVPTEASLLGKEKGLTILEEVTAVQYTDLGQSRAWPIGTGSATLK